MKNTLHFTFLRTLIVLAFGLFFNVAWGQYSGVGNFTPVPTIQGSGYYMIAGNGNTNKGLMLNSVSGNFIGYTGVTSLADEINNPSVNNVFYIEVSENNFTIYNSVVQKYVSYDSGNTATLVSGPVSNKERWTISNNSNNLYFTNVQTTSRNLSWNNGSPRFACYGNFGQTGLTLYKLQAPSTSPNITTDVTELNFASADVLTVSASQTFNVSGANLTENISVTVPSADFQVSLNEVDWSNTITIAQTGGTVASTTVYARFSPQTTGEKSGNITVVSADATTVNVAVSGTGTIPSPVAVAATSVASNSFTANWASVLGASSYEIDVYTMVSGSSASDLIISEYVEGSSSNKAIEIFNGTGAAVDLSDYSLRKQVNGSGDYGSDLELLGTLENNSTYVIVGNQVNSALSAYGNFSTGSGAMSFNGNDAVALYKEGTKIDEVGVFDQSSNWGADVTLRRKATVSSPLATYNILEWDEFSIDTFNGLGQHTFDGGSSVNYIFQNENIGNVTSFNVIGLEEGTEYFYVVRAISGTSESESSNVINVTTISTSTTWSGTAWSNEVPTNTSDAIIAGDYNTATNGTFTAKSLTVNSGIFTVASGTSVTVENAVTSAGATNFIVESNANLIQTSSAANTGAITVERESALLVRLDHTLWSSPVDAQKLFAFSPNTLTNRFYTYATATNNYVNTGLSATTDFIVGKGYGVRAPNDHSTTPATWMGTFTGVPNNGDVSFTLTNVGEGFNLVGNPYPSVVDGAAFVAANSTRINGTLYFYAHTLTMNAQGVFPAGTNYALWNGTGQTAAATGTSGVPALVPNGKIQVGQGFLVKSTNSSALVFNNTMREANTGNQFFRTAFKVQATSEAEKHRLWLNLTNAEGTTFNQILVGYVAGATQEIDNLYDGLSFGNEGSALSSRLSNEDYTIQGRALPFNAADVVPLGFKAVTPGNYTISLSDMDGVFAADQNVFLKDNANGTINNIKTAPYTFTAEAGTFNNRFEVVYQSTLGTPESTFTSSSVVAYVKEAQLNIQTKGNSMKAVSVYDVRGRLLFSKSEINAADFVAQELAAQNQVLLVQVTAENGEVATVKVIF